jgi:hypothetical protein
MDVQELRSAYDRFFDLAEHSGFKEPAPGEWSALEIVAHVAFRDVLLADVTEALVDGSEMSYDDQPPYANTPVATAEGLDALVRGRSYAEVLMLARENAQRLVAAAARLDDRAAGRLVPSRIVDAGEAVADRAVPWGALLETEARRHIPARTEQLESLCV